MPFNYTTQPDNVCSRCKLLVLPSPTLRWELRFGTVMKVLEGSRQDCSFCTVVRVALRLSMYEHSDADLDKAVVQLHGRGNENTGLYLSLNGAKGIPSQFIECFETKLPSPGSNVY
jgi:hypothetical protein